MKKIGSCLGKIVKYIFYGYLAIMVIGLLLKGVNDAFGTNDKPVQAADGFTIEEYQVVLDVQQDNKVDVCENITVNWDEEHHHGIVRFIPQWLEYTGKDEKRIKRKSKVLDLKSTSDPYELDVVKKKDRIRLGNKNEYVPLGNKKYEIQYTYDMGKDPFKNFDEFIFHTYGDYWGTEIKNASVKIILPKKLDHYNIHFFADKYRSNDVTQFVDYTIDGNVIDAKFNQEKYTKYQKEEYCKENGYLENDECEVPEYSGYNEKLDHSLTVDIELPDHYFVGGSWTYGWGSFGISLVIILLTIYTIYKWYKYGKDFPKRERTIEYYPMDHLNAAEIGYIYGNHSMNKLTIALMIQIASKGYIKIDELENKKIQITNLCSPPKGGKPFEGKVERRKIEVEKLKEADDSLSNDAKKMMENLFRKKNSNTLKTNYKKFEKVSDELVNGKYIQIISDNDETRYGDLEKLRKEYEEKNKDNQEEWDAYKKYRATLKPLSELERIVYSQLFIKDNVIIVSEHKTLYKAFQKVEEKLTSKLKDLVVDRVATKKMYTSIGITILTVILNLISFFIVEDMNPNWSILYWISMSCILINLVFTIFMKRKTKYGEEIIARIKGFKEFLEKVEKPKLEELVMENPTYFYDILPYTYVLNISKKWIDKFENIPIPEQDMGTLNYYNDRSYYLIYSNVEYPKTSSSGRGSLGGGGFSSSGGGCSSCGGGGSW